MPESKRNPKTAAKARERRALEAEEHRIANETATKRSTAPSRFDNRSWVPWVFVPVMILGGLYIVVNNMAGEKIPVMQDLNIWNMVIGLGLIIVGLFGMTLWK